MNNARLHRQVSSALTRDIAGGVVAPGARLPRLTDLASRYGVSRGVIREALLGLEEKGLVTMQQGRGTTVTDPRHWNALDPDVLAALLDDPAEGGMRVLHEYLECRRILEVEAAGFAAERAALHDLQAIADAFARMEQHSSRSQLDPHHEDLFHEADAGFHQAVLAAAGNRTLVWLSQPLQATLIAARQSVARLILASNPDYRTQKTLPEHRRILTALVNREAGEARSAMHDHLTGVEEWLRRAASAQ